MDSNFSGLHCSDTLLQGILTEMEVYDNEYASIIDIYFYEYFL